ncbi:hypothetical protein [Yersinia proxima]|uniref:hypothetical protein n=1 Tax=Yersinia proxima TaxID=2890316 RepID=UPI001D12FC32|nr:hypothetical protein [Yersinia proxima]
MTKAKGIVWDTVRANLISDPEVQTTYEVEERKEHLQAMLAECCRHAGLIRAQIANEESIGY